MLYYIKKYPVSLLVILVVIYLSFFRPPSIGEVEIPHLDKLVHFCMYFGVSAMLWFEFLRAHKWPLPALRAWIGACLCPILFSGVVEILQEYATDYRGGEWLDFAANSLGVLTASLLAWYAVVPWFGRKFRGQATQS